MEKSKVRLTLRQDNIVEIECEPNTVMTLEEGVWSTKKVRELTSDKILPMLCDLTNVVKMTQECRQYFAGPEHAKVFSKCALVIVNPISRIIGNFFLGANKPLRPTKLFTDKGKGIKWLLEQRD